MDSSDEVLNIFAGIGLLILLVILFWHFLRIQEAWINGDFTALISLLYKKLSGKLVNENKKKSAKNVGILILITYALVFSGGILMKSCVNKSCQENPENCNKRKINPDGYRYLNDDLTEQLRPEPRGQ